MGCTSYSLARSQIRRLGQQGHGAVYRTYSQRISEFKICGDNRISFRQTSKIVAVSSPTASTPSHIPKGYILGIHHCCKISKIFAVICGLYTATHVAGESDTLIRVINQFRSILISLGTRDFIIIEGVWRIGGKNYRGITWRAIK